MPRMMIPLEDDEKRAIWDIAMKEKRDPRQQASLFLRQRLEELGLLPIKTIEIQIDKKQGDK